MKNLIIQHFVPAKAGLDPVRKMEDDIPMLVKKSSENVQEYAKRFNSDYKMLSGTPFRKNLSYKCQKCAIINEEYDEYDIVVALDTDVFFTKRNHSKYLIKIHKNLNKPHKCSFFKVLYESSSNGTHKVSTPKPYICFVFLFIQSFH